MEPTLAESYVEHPFSLTEFESRWGKSVAIDTDTLALMWRDSEELMPPLPYHNFEHVTKTLFAAMDICDQHEAADPGYTYNRRVLAAAVLFHDCLFSADPTENGYDSKEALSTEVFKQFAPHYGFSDAEVMQGSAIILTTKLGEKPETPEQQVMVQADIFNTSQSYEKHFLPNMRRIAEEAGLRRDELSNSAAYLTFVANTLRIVSTYAVAVSNDNEFRTNVARNLQRLATDTAREQGTNVVSYIQNLGCTALTKLLPKSEE